MPSPTLLTPPAPTAKPTTSLKHEAKIGIGVSIGVFVSALVFVAILDACVLRRRRRERAMQNAVEEVERGGATFKESRERIVLESRVSIVFDETEPEDEEDDDGGRNGMSLPRRVYV
ncbi:hypothetical protein P154DRAFT_518759 [Amniculicola lignicola CBS 123094]|uniref:Uncharacterized protein n=1 Tax=Amniculicola lignicola CBS 123094 TaxID=1392246 RepID=A0A6A5WVS5_9PLEO|nr:hypothetical protein P154DRAFT_518759 [Amniculicola lignicola CBS 123094]